MDEEEEYEYDYGSDQDSHYDYGSDQGEAEEGAGSGGGGIDSLIEIENSFYEGDDLKNDQPQAAIEMFEKVVLLESKLGDQVKWRFKALQNLVVIYFSQKIYDKMIERYRAMLAYISSVTRNECTDAVNAILDTLTTTVESKVLSEMYEITLLALKSANNERLWFNTNLKLAKLYLEDRKLSEVERLIQSLKLTCRSPDGSDDISKGTYLLEVYCLEIQLCAVTHNSARMKEIYPKTLNLNSAVADPRIMGIIREEGGKMQMAEGNWEEAYNELYEAFRNYQEAGNSRAKDCLKYVVLASMLSLSGINPFAAREAKVFSDDKEIIAMSDLRLCLEANDLGRFERTIGNKQNRILDEPFLMTYIQPLRQRMREQVLLNLVGPYDVVTLQFLADQLSIPTDEVEIMLVSMILDGKLAADIDQTTDYVYLINSKESFVDTEERLVGGWGDTLMDISTSFGSRMV
mmetsp:Transcript_22304/g.30547  ORF Transcript_22304/g.30547 Transcript_22304/m.30547 type:complete len:461 (+) Transcript_22304:72-1454(+)|eukprot:CAMPEP_0170115370 /NCGR_PEP_ID=MMETSP0020_2-20130122/11437_1 /TAXON_ID=98059 /ORGANISM="Dinobryon sp., Strain UTEXLB2267" /LENGTH=460 /DNA_ID=CAMNT_0010342891 /DNA_START=74 /DNA_END=1456 /DNA_ORIENTATION=+